MGACTTREEPRPKQTLDQRLEEAERILGIYNCNPLYIQKAFKKITTPFLSELQLLQILENANIKSWLDYEYEAEKQLVCQKFFNFFVDEEMKSKKQYKSKDILIACIFMTFYDAKIKAELIFDELAEENVDQIDIKTLQNFLDLILRLCEQLIPSLVSLEEIQQDDSILQEIQKLKSQ